MSLVEHDGGAVPFKPIFIPLIRNIMPNLVVEDIISVQSMMDLNSNYKLNVNYNPGPYEPHEFGTLVHSFLYGYYVELGDGGRMFVQDFLDNYPMSCIIDRRYEVEDYGY